MNKLFQQDSSVYELEKNLSPSYNDYLLIELNTKYLSSSSRINEEQNQESQDLIGNLTKSVIVSNIKLNILFMIFSICLLVCYSYLIKKDINSQEEEMESVNKKKTPWISEIDSSSDESDVEPLIEVKDPVMRDFLELKKKKMEKNANLSIHWIVHSLFVIYLMSVWDIADVFQYFRMHNWNESNMNLLLQNNSNYDNFLRTLDSPKQARLVLANGQVMADNERADLENIKNDPTFKGTIKYLCSYFNNYDDNFYKHYFSHYQLKSFNSKKLVLKSGENEGQVGKDTGDENIVNKEYKTITKIRALFVLKIHSQIFGDLLILSFSLFVLSKIKYIEALLEWNPREHVLQTY